MKPVIENMSDLSSGNSHHSPRRSAGWRSERCNRLINRKINRHKVIRNKAQNIDEKSVVIPKIRSEPSFQLRDRYLFPSSVVFDLIFRNFVDAEIAGFRMGEVQAADAGCGMHGEALCQSDTCLSFCIQQLEQFGFLGVIWTGRIAVSRPNSSRALATSTTANHVSNLNNMIELTWSALHNYNRRNFCKPRKPWHMCIWRHNS